MTERRGSPSILPNSSEEILKPMAGGLQVRWDESINSHVLYHNETKIVSKHNGFSCHNLAERMLAGNVEHALAQFEYITDCGGRHYMTQEEFEELTRNLEKETA